MEDIRFVPGRSGELLAPNKQRKRLLITINLFCIIIMIPFAIKAFMNSYTWLGGFLFAFAISLAINTVCVFRRGREFFHYSLVAGFIVIALSLAVYHLGIAAVFWVFPVIVIATFVLPMRAALIFSILLAVSVSILIGQQVSSAAVIRLVASLLLTIIACYVVVSSIQELQQKLRKVSEEDPLTGLYNRRQLDRKLTSALEQFNHKKTSAVILLLDIDRFKSVNDEFGHDIGDKAIKMVAKAIKNNTRKIDIGFRLGGDEFLVLLNNIDWKQGYTIAETIRSEVEKLSSTEPFSISVSIGASITSKGIDKSSWMKQADNAMYQAKLNGRNGVQLLSEA